MIQNGECNNSLVITVHNMKPMNFKDPSASIYDIFLDLDLRIPKCHINMHQVQLFNLYNMQ